MSGSEGAVRAAGVQPSTSSIFLEGITSGAGDGSGLGAGGSGLGAVQDDAIRSGRLHSSEESSSARGRKNKRDRAVGGRGNWSEGSV